MDKERIHTVGALAFNGSKVLLVKHGEAAQHLTGVYGLPGGRVDGDESLLDAAAREFEEETGLVPEKTTMVSLPTIIKGEIPRKNGEILRTLWYVFLVKNFSGELKETDETTPEWVDISEVLSLNHLPDIENVIQEGLRLLSK